MYVVADGGKRWVWMTWTTAASADCQSPAVGLLWEGSGHALVAVEASRVVKPARLALQGS